MEKTISKTKLLAESLELLTHNDFHALSSIIYQRQVICDVPGQGTTVWDMPGKAAKQAAAEFEALFEEIIQ